MRIFNYPLYLIIEFILLFVGVPLLLYFDNRLIHPSAILIPVLAGIITYFIFQKEFKFRDLIRMDISKTLFWKNICIVALSGIVLFGLVYIFDRSNLLNLPKRNPLIWLGMCIFYPVFSAYAQEVIYRSFLFLRYKVLFKNNTILILVSGIMFSFMHIVYYNPVSIILTLIAGIYLSYVYSKTRSVLFTAILHGLLGILVFTAGLGQYFWLDMFEWL